jgi:anti-sigma regulatory factor (Ser/Thr protein kinase)
VAAETIDSRRTLRIPEARLTDLARIRAFLRHATVDLGADPHALADILIAVNEAAANVLRHGYKGPGWIEVDVDRDAATGALVIHLRDEAPLFDPTQHPTPDREAALERRRPGGFGVHLARESVDRLSWHARPGAGNELTFLKELPHSDERTAR